MYLMSDLSVELTFHIDQYLLVRENRERLCVSQRVAQKFDMGVLISRRCFV